MSGGVTRPAPDRSTAGLADAFGVWIRLGVLSFGGPAGQIALMHRMLVDERGWLDEAQFLRALNFCMLLPGPEAMQLATYAGWRLHGWRGGLAAGLCFVLPGAALMTVLAVSYAAFGQMQLVQALFLGVKAAVLAIVVEALIRIARRALKHGSDWAIAGAAFVAIFLAGVPFPLIILTAAAFGAMRSRAAGPAAIGAAGRVGVRRTLGTVALWSALWFVPLLALAGGLGDDHVLVQIGWFFSKLAVVTFGGAYAVLAYMAQAAVEHHGWLDAGAMLDGRGLAETTPGPLILVTQFVGYQAGFGSVPGGSLWLGLAGAAVTLWVTFVPCFMWVLAGAPFIEALAGRPRLTAALAGITAAVVGVILNLSLWFGLRVLFAEFEPVAIGPVTVGLPVPDSLDLPALAIVGLAALMLFGGRFGIVSTLGLCALAGVLARLAF
ncbi:MAG: chromate efflux transporter [Inquilinus sp.]|nr:chromate efflux transporter [Inquilinus sp.]